jgi:hypothetical protein
MSKFVELEVKPEGASGSVLAIPLSSTGSDGKAKTWTVRDEKGASLMSVDASTSKTTLGAIAGGLRLPDYADDTARDAAIPSPVRGMLVYNHAFGSLQVYDGGSWVTMATV